MRKNLFFFLFVLVCGVAAGGRYPSPDALPPLARGDHLRVVFALSEDPSSTVMPFPNDLLWGLVAAKAGFPEPFVLLDPESAGSVEEAGLYALVTAAHLKGLSPNMFISVPISKPVPLKNVKGHYRLVDLTDLQTCAASFMSSPACRGIDDTSRLVFRQEGHVLKFYPVEPLDPGHTYVLVLLKGIVSEEGQPLEKPWNAEFFEAQEPISGPSVLLEPVRKKFAALYAALEGLDPRLNRESILVLVPFTVAEKTLSTAAFAMLEGCLSSYAPQGKGAVAACVFENFSRDPERYVVSYRDEDGNGIPDVAQEAYGLVGAVKIIFATYRRVVSDPVRFCSAFVDYSGRRIRSFRVDAYDAARIVADYAAGDVMNLAAYVAQLMKDPSVREDVPFAVYGSGYYDGSLLMYQHGLGGNKEMVKPAADVLKRTVVAMDLPWHGERTPQVGPCSVHSGACFLTANVAQDRVNYYQAVVDQTVLMLVAKSGCLDLNGDGVPGDVPERFFYSGISLGAITGSMFVALNYQDPTGGPFKVDAAVLNVGGANYAALVDEATRGPIESLICSAVGGDSLGFDCGNYTQAAAFARVAKLTALYPIVLGIFQTLLDPSDPAYVVRGALPSGDALDKVVLQNAYGDTFVPNVSNTALARAFGYGNPVFVSSPADAVPQAGWYMFGDEDHLAVHSFIFTEGLYSECGISPDAPYQARLRCLLGIYPELAPFRDRLNPDYIEGLMRAAWYQTGAFLR